MNEYVRYNERTKEYNSDYSLVKYQTKEQQGYLIQWSQDLEYALIKRENKVYKVDREDITYIP